MKKFIVAIVTILYVASTSGATIHFHYCMGKLINAGLTNESNSKCSKCGMNKKKSTNACCKDEHKFVKLAKDHIKGSFELPVYFSSDVIFDNYSSACFHNFGTSNTVDFTPINGPPISSTPLFIRYCNFRI